VPASSILLLDADAAAAQSILPVLTGVGYTVTLTADADDAFSKVGDHQLVIIDVVVGSKPAAELCAEIRATPAMAGVPVLCISQTDDVDERIRFLESGADDVMARPFDARELEARVEALLLRFQRSRGMMPVFSADGLTVARVRRIVAVYSPKGGVGTTTIATNIAVAAALKRPDRVVLVDMSLQFGGVASHLNLPPRQTLADIVRDETAMRESEIMKTYAMRHSSGLHVIAAPGSPEGAALVTPELLETVIKMLLEGYDSIVIDVGSNLDERTMTVLDAAETVVLPVYPEMTSLNAVASLLDYFNEVGSIGGKSMFVLNNTFAREILKLRDIENALGTKISIDLLYDPFIYLKAVNEGVPVVIGSARTPAAERFTKLSSSAFGEDGFQVPEGAGERKPGRFAFRRRA
jgi:pilus assembly protein CpaE